MKNALSAATAAAILSVATHAHANELSCYTDPRTDARTCYSPSKLKEKDGIRHSPLYSGGPNRLRETGMSIHVNCKTQVVHLKDRDGVSFAGGRGSETKAVASLRSWICAENIRKK